MMRYLLWLILTLSMALAQSAGAAIETYPFDTPEQERLYHQLIRELRCMVCQNQNLADSNARLARDLRRQIHALVIRGYDRDAVVNYMVQRYGEFVRYRPAFNAHTALLWLGPLLLLLIAGLTVWRVQRQARETASDD